MATSDPVPEPPNPWGNLRDDILNDDDDEEFFEGTLF